MNSELPKTPAAAPAASTATAKAAGTELDSLPQKLVEQKDQHLRLAADFENFKRRSRQEAESRAAAQKEAFIHELLPVIDNLERALASGPTPDSAQLRQGVEMTLQQLRQLLRQHGVESGEIAGQLFDPLLHEAVSQGHAPAQADHSILEVFQRGYRRGTKIIRPAKVMVNNLAHAKDHRHAS